MSGKPRVVVCAALKREDGLIICGARHFDPLMNKQITETQAHWDTNYEQGFVDQCGVFMTREEAHQVAQAAGQIKYRCGGDKGELFSENLY